MNAAIPPPPFLQCPGVPPIPWRQWRPVLQVYIDAAARDATPEHKKVLLLNALGVEGLNRFLREVDEEQLPGADRETPEDAYSATLDLLERVFNPGQHPACVRTQFKFLRQRPDETAVEFIQEVQRQVKLCEFGAAGEFLVFDQIVTGISSPHLQRVFFKMGKDFTVQKALSVAREEERVDRALEQLSGAHVDSVSSRRVHDSVPAVCDNKRRFSDMLIGSSSKIHNSRMFRDELLNDSDEEDAHDDVQWSTCADSSACQDDIEEDAAMRKLGELKREKVFARRFGRQ
ncbi:hypothetical protein HPB50_018069 [Hyalomma asiaticum]|uniref:Uncharacterized protein n=1 Tax=Hyalomma asiaticum TaxID=266040 RepID=A0ACB7SGA3_HYAAI|nr:hypothetical protein HPB50_018069 [Hyalomma asiaticum]